jgi:hypothetical protein
LEIVLSLVILAAIASAAVQASKYAGLTEEQISRIKTFE